MGVVGPTTVQNNPVGRPEELFWKPDQQALQRANQVSEALLAGSDPKAAAGLLSEGCQQVATHIFRRMMLCIASVGLSSSMSQLLFPVPKRGLPKNGAHCGPQSDSILKMGTSRGQSPPPKEKSPSFIGSLPVGIPDKDARSQALLQHGRARCSAGGSLA